jgi:putative spermidine/putrescine transport system substrate-binding protein
MTNSDHARGSAGRGGAVLPRRAALAVPMLALPWLGAGRAQAQGSDFIVAANGDPYEAMWRRSQVPDFEAATGRRVVWSPGLSAQIMARLISQRARPQVDVALVDEGPFVQGLDLGVWESFAPGELGDTSDIVASALEYPQGAAYGFSAVGLYYNAEIFAANGWAPPTSWMDLLRPELERKITLMGLNNSAGVNSLVALNSVAGGTTPGNMDPGFALARRMARHALAIDTAGETPQLIQQRTAVAGAWIQQRVIGLAETGIPIRFVAPREGVWGHRLMAAVVKGRPPENVAAGKRYIAQMLTQKQQTASLSLNPLPVNRTVASDKVEPGLGARVNIPDQRAIQRQRAAWVERWAKEVERA